jgi:hypothetical protein
MSASDFLGAESKKHMHPVGLRGGTGPHDINNKTVNVTQAPKDLDRDGDHDGGVSKELSDSYNNQGQKLAR